MKPPNAKISKGLWEVFRAPCGQQKAIEDLDQSVTENIPPSLRRDSPVLEHQNFHRYHSETEMMRYLRRTAGKDVSLGRSMIPLGSFHHEK
ncbi:MAG: hypothetical protein CM1200mP41_37480 [Gammaproteobacteria bacterium]|nr:MAG: hypothetical protein CM1200mP41_37480 [Gammaproteobacteria bacterium]